MAMVFRLDRKSDRKRARVGELEVNMEVCQWWSSSCSLSVKCTVSTRCLLHFYKSHLTSERGVHYSYPDLIVSHSAVKYSDESDVHCGKQYSFSHVLTHKHL